MARTIILVVVAFLLAGVDASAEMYQYVDDQGALHFVESLSEVPKKHRRKATVAGEEGNVSYAEPAPVSAKAGKKKSPVEERQQFTGSVEIYVTSWCPACKAALTYVKSNGITYAAYDIEKDADAKRRSEGFSGRGVPLIHAFGYLLSTPHALALLHRGPPFPALCPAVAASA